MTYICLLKRIVFHFTEKMAIMQHAKINILIFKDLLFYLFYDYFAFNKLQICY